MTLITRYRALLRWYPRDWRASNGDVLLGTLLDVAEAEGRSHPTVAESWSIRRAGLGERFTVRAALVATAWALLVALATTAFTMFQIGGVAQIGGGWITAALGQFGAPTLLSFAVLCLLRNARIVLPAQALTVFLVAALGWAFAAAAALSWSVAFDEADAGGISSPLAQAFVPLLGGAWAVGGCALFLLTHARRVPRSAQWAAAGCAAVITPPVLGLGTVSPLMPALVALAILFVCGLNRRPRTTVRPAAPHPVSLAVRKRAALFAIITLAVSLVSVVFAATGGSWSAGIDSTRAMQLGLSAGQLSAIPLLFCLAWVLQCRRPLPFGHRWPAVLLIALGLAIGALDTIFEFTRSGDLPWPGIAAIVLGLGLLTFETLRITGALRGILSAATALVLVVPVWGIVVMLGFIVPIAAVVMVIWGLGNPRQKSEALAATVA